MGCCALGTCELSKAHGGAGCDLCDRVARLPQPMSGREVMRRSEERLTSRQAKKAAGQKTTKS